MADPSAYTYPSPLANHKNLPPLPTTLTPDGKSLVNPPSQTLSSAYTTFPPPLDNDSRRGAFDVHVYFLQSSPDQTAFAKALWERVRREFPELRVYRVWEEPVGPHPVGMFEVNLFTPAQFGAFVSWLVIARGPLSVLVHPNTVDGDAFRNHSQQAMWMGTPYPLNLAILRKETEEKEKEG